MTAEELICPIMSRPMQVLEDCDDPECKLCNHMGVFKGKYEGFIPCQREKCMAYVTIRRPFNPKKFEYCELIWRK